MNEQSTAKTFLIALKLVPLINTLIVEKDIDIVCYLPFFHYEDESQCGRARWGMWTNVHLPQVARRSMTSVATSTIIYFCHRNIYPIIRWPRYRHINCFLLALLQDTYLPDDGYARTPATFFVLFPQIDRSVGKNSCCFRNAFYDCDKTWKYYGRISKSCIVSIVRRNNFRIILFSSLFFRCCCFSPLTVFSFGWKVFDVFYSNLLVFECCGIAALVITTIIKPCALAL